MADERIFTGRAHRHPPVAEPPPAGRLDRSRPPGRFGLRLAPPVQPARVRRGDLPIVHGTGDDNVHYQNFEAPVNQFVRFNKAFTRMASPNRSHGSYEGENTTPHLNATILHFLEESLGK